MSRTSDPANNVWYNLLTLHGEHGLGFDERLHLKNRSAWDVLGFAPRAEQKPGKWSGVGSRTRGGYVAGQEHLEVKLSGKMSGNFRSIPESGPVDLTDLHFQKPLQLNGFGFLYHVSLQNSVFEEPVRMNKCLFRGGLDLRGAVFKKGLFMEGSGVEGALHASEMQWARELDASNSRFVGSADFREMKTIASKAARCSFRNTVFEEISDFYEGEFGDHAVFEKARFGGDAGFSRVAFKRGVTFRGAVFDDYSYFQGTEFVAAPGTRTEHINFTECRFERPPTFRGATFKNEFPNFAGAILHERSTFTAEEDQWPRSGELSTRAKEASANSISVAAESAASLRALMSKQGLPDEEHFFFRREMDLRVESSPVLQSLVLRGYKAVSNYGHSISKPVSGLMWLWYVSGIVYLSSGLFGRASGVLSHDIAQILKVAGFSAANILKFLGFQRRYFDEVFADAPGWVQAITAAQTFLGFVLLFFLGLGLRQRFRLR